MRPYCYIRLSVVVAIIWEHFLWTRHGRKSQNCLWNFDAICHSSRDISISCLGGHIAISGCRSLLLLFGDTFFDVAVVRKLDFVTWIATILILDLFCHISQHDHKISPKIHTCLTSYQRTSGAPIGDLIVAFCTHFIFRKSHERTVHNAEQNFLLIQKLSCRLFLPPSAIPWLKIK